jgi:hypothetical protein
MLNKNGGSKFQNDVFEPVTVISTSPLTDDPAWLRSGGVFG